MTPIRAGHWRCKNLPEKVTLTGPHQAYVSDITYIDTEQGFTYLTLITDAHSRYIVGYVVSDSLATAASLQTLNQALAHRPAVIRSSITTSGAPSSPIGSIGPDWVNMADGLVWASGVTAMTMTWPNE